MYPPGAGASEQGRSRFGGTRPLVALAAGTAWPASSMDLQVTFASLKYHL